MRVFFCYTWFAYFQVQLLTCCWHYWWQWISRYCWRRSLPPHNTMRSTQVLFWLEDLSTSFPHPFYRVYSHSKELPFLAAEACKNIFQVVSHYGLLSTASLHAKKTNWVTSPYLTIHLISLHTPVVFHSQDKQTEEFLKNQEYFVPYFFHPALQIVFLWIKYPQGAGLIRSMRYHHQAQHNSESLRVQIIHHQDFLNATGGLREFSILFLL